jgi:hypothetical protein
MLSLLDGSHYEAKSQRKLGFIFSAALRRSRISSRLAKTARYGIGCNDKREGKCRWCSEDISNRLNLALPPDAECRFIGGARGWPEMERLERKSGPQKR